MLDGRRKSALQQDSLTEDIDCIRRSAMI